MTTGLYPNLEGLPKKIDWSQRRPTWDNATGKHYQVAQYVGGSLVVLGAGLGLLANYFYHNLTGTPEFVLRTYSATKWASRITFAAGILTVVPFTYWRSDRYRAGEAKKIAGRMPGMGYGNAHQVAEKLQLFSQEEWNRLLATDVEEMGLEAFRAKHTDAAFAILNEASLRLMRAAFVQSLGDTTFEDAMRAHKEEMELLKFDATSFKQAYLPHHYRRFVEGKMTYGQFREIAGQEAVLWAKTYKGMVLDWFKALPYEDMISEKYAPERQELRMGDAEIKEELLRQAKKEGTTYFTFYQKHGWKPFEDKMLPEAAIAAFAQQLGTEILTNGFLAAKAKGIDIAAMQIIELGKHQAYFRSEVLKLHYAQFVDRHGLECLSYLDATSMQLAQEQYVAGLGNDAKFTDVPAEISTALKLDAARFLTLYRKNQAQRLREGQITYADFRIANGGREAVSYLIPDDYPLVQAFLWSLPYDTLMSEEYTSDRRTIQLREDAINFHLSQGAQCGFLGERGFFKFHGVGPLRDERLTEEALDVVRKEVRAAVEAEGFAALENQGVTVWVLEQLDKEGYGKFFSDYMRDNSYGALVARHGMVCLSLLSPEMKVQARKECVARLGDDAQFKDLPPIVKVVLTLDNSKFLYLYRSNQAERMRQDAVTYAQFRERCQGDNPVKYLLEEGDAAHVLAYLKTLPYDQLVHTRHRTERRKAGMDHQAVKEHLSQQAQELAFFGVQGFLEFHGLGPLKHKALMQAGLDAIKEKLTRYAGASQNWSDVRQRHHLYELAGLSDLFLQTLRERLALATTWEQVIRDAGPALAYVKGEGLEAVSKLVIRHYLANPARAYSDESKTAATRIAESNGHLLPTIAHTSIDLLKAEVEGAKRTEQGAIAAAKQSEAKQLEDIGLVADRKLGEANDPLAAAERESRSAAADLKTKQEALGQAKEQAASLVKKLEVCSLSIDHKEQEQGEIRAQLESKAGQSSAQKVARAKAEVQRLSAQLQLVESDLATAKEQASIRTRMDQLNRRLQAARTRLKGLGNVEEARRQLTGLQAATRLASLQQQLQGLQSAAALQEELAKIEGQRLQLGETVNGVEAATAKQRLDKEHGEITAQIAAREELEGQVAVAARSADLNTRIPKGVTTASLQRQIEEVERLGRQQVLDERQHAALQRNLIERPTGTVGELESKQAGLAGQLATAQQRVKRLETLKREINALEARQVQCRQELDALDQQRSQHNQIARELEEKTLPSLRKQVRAATSRKEEADQTLAAAKRRARDEKAQIEEEKRRQTEDAKHSAEMKIKRAEQSFAEAVQGFHQNFKQRLESLISQEAS